MSLASNGSGTEWRVFNTCGLFPGAGILTPDWSKPIQASPRFLLVEFGVSVLSAARKMDVRVTLHSTLGYTVSCDRHHKSRGRQERSPLPHFTDKSIESQRG